MLGPLFLALQAASAAPPPVISFHAIVDVRSAKVQSRGQSTVRAWAQPEGGSQTLSSGGSNSRHFELHIDARIADPLAAQAAPAQEETAPPQPR